MNKNKSLRLDTLIFDFDGTLFDTEDGIIDSFRYAVENNGLGKKSDSELRSWIGIPLDDLFEKLTKDKKVLRKCIKDHRKRYAELIFKETRLFPGAKRFLTKNQNRWLVIASTKPEPFVRKILRHYKMTGLFDLIIGSPIHGRELQKEKILDRALSQMKKKGISADDGAYIGDRKYDMEAGRHHGLTAIGVSFGIGGRKELTKAKADIIVKSFEELDKAIKSGF